MKVLLVEDEKKIGELISRLIDWERFGLELIACIQDGKDGYEKILEERPEIVITDIRMPTMSGLEIIREVREKKIPCHFIVISGYQQFEYAKIALQYQVDDYLLKPISKEELSITLERVVHKIQKNEENLMIQKEMQRDLSLKTEQLKKQFLLDFARNPEGICQWPTDEINREYGCNFREKCMQIIILKIDCVNEYTQQFFLLILKRCQKVLQDYMEEENEKILSYFSEDYLLIMLIGEGGSKRKTLIEEYARRLDGIMNGYNDLNICVCPGCVVTEFCDLYRSFYEAKRAVQYRILRKNYNLSIAPEAKKPDLNEVFFSSDKIYDLKNNIEKRNFSWVKDFLRYLFRYIEGKQFKITPGDIYLLLDEVLEHSESSLKVSEQYRDCNFDFAETRMYIRHSTTLPALLYGFQKSYLKELHAYFIRSEQMGNRPVRLAIQYLTEHYGEQLTLKSVSEKVDLSPNYFSAVFKKEMDISFIDYLTNYRLSQAKKMLRETNDSIAVIAEKVGYNDFRYFSRLFSKSFGITPNKYRKL